MGSYQFVSLLDVSVLVHVCHGMCVVKGQPSGTGPLSPSTMWIPGINLRLPHLCASMPTTEHLTSSRKAIRNVGGEEVIKGLIHPITLFSCMKISK